MGNYKDIARKFGVAEDLGESEKLMQAALMKHSIATLWAGYSLIKDEAKLYEVVLGVWQDIRKQVPQDTSDIQLQEILGPALGKHVGKTMELA